jgi:hypothetical protein
MNSPSGRDKILLNPYREWAKAQRIPIYEGFGLDLLALETSRWDFTETNGALVHLNGRGDYASVFLIDIPEAGKTRLMQHCFEEVVYVLEGHGSTSVVVRWHDAIIRMGSQKPVLDTSQLSLSDF